jgi:Family of unknown function (DUF5681)
MRQKIDPRHPPPGNRFVKGQSGNPKGRPKKARPTPSAFDVVLARTFTARSGGVDGEVTAEEAIQFATLEAALAGNRAARRQVLRWIENRDRILAEKAKPQRVTIPTRIRHDPENANEALLLLAIARYASEEAFQQLLLEPWAVQMALSRRRGGQRLTDGEIQDIKRCTRDPNSVPWPRGSEP